MRPRPRVVAFALAAVLVALDAPAGENYEEITSDLSILDIRHDASRFPIAFLLHNAGVVVDPGSGTTDMTNDQAITAITDGLGAWTAPATTAVLFDSIATTTTQDSSCDFTNLITFSDEATDWEEWSGFVALAITWTYVGPDLAIDSGTRSGVQCQNRITGGSMMIDLPASYPDGTTLLQGTILDADFTLNARENKFLVAPNDAENEVDLQYLTTHEVGHLVGIAHASMVRTAPENFATMWPGVEHQAAEVLEAQREPVDDDVSAVGALYPGNGFFPGGTPPFTTGAISGSVFQSEEAGLTPSGDLMPATGVRVWAYSVQDIEVPLYERFTATDVSLNSGLAAGEYLIEGAEPGDYYVCIVPWFNELPFANALVDYSDPDWYNKTAQNGVGNSGFSTECFDDAESTADTPEFADWDRVRRVTVTAGRTAPRIDFVTGAETTDFMLVLDRSGSMNGWSANGIDRKIVALKDAARCLIDYLELSGDHRLGIVQFNGDVYTPSDPFDLQPLDTGSVGTAQMEISSMSAGGLTNIVAGIEEAIHQLTDPAIDPNPRQVMLVFTDGMHNAGGATLASVEPTVVDNDVRFYSIGFGTSVDEAVLTDIALATGGTHQNEDGLDPDVLKKHFLAVGASAVNDSVLVDPHFDLDPGDVATLDVPAGARDQSLKLVVGWQTRDRNRLSIQLLTPDGCRLPLQDPNVAQVRRRSTHSMIRVPLPATCNGVEAHEGVWRLAARHAGTSGSEPVDIVAFGRTRDRLVTELVGTPAGDAIRIALVDHGRSRPLSAVSVEVLQPLPRNDDPGDVVRGGPPVIPEGFERSERTVELIAKDDGNNGDLGDGDGVFGVLIEGVRIGIHEAWIVAEYERDGVTLHREERVTFHFDGTSIVGVKGPHGGSP